MERLERDLETYTSIAGVITQYILDGLSAFEHDPLSAEVAEAIHIAHPVFPDGIGFLSHDYADAVAVHFTGLPSLREEHSNLIYIKDCYRNFPEERIGILLGSVFN